MPELSKIDLNALRKADDLVVHWGGRTGQTGEVRAIKRKSYNSADPFETDKEHVLTTVEIGGESYREKEANARGSHFFASVGLYHDQMSTASAIIRTLRVGDELKFIFYADAHSNGYMALHGLHGDALKLTVRRKGKTVARWTLQTSCCPDNSARMCRGSVPDDSYRHMADDARKNCA